MSSRITVRPTTSVGIIGVVAVISGFIMMLVGAGTWAVVSQQLAQERIVVSEDAPFFRNQVVAGPFTAYAQAQAINDHALDAAGGQTYAELAKDDPDRAMVMNASFLRASLFTSVVAFGLAGFVLGSGLLFVLVGWALHRSAGGPPVIIDTDTDGPLQVVDQRGRPARGIPSEPVAEQDDVVPDGESLGSAATDEESDTSVMSVPAQDDSEPAGEEPEQVHTNGPVEPAPLPPHAMPGAYGAGAGASSDEFSAPLRMSRSARALSDQRVRPESAPPSLTGAIPIVGGPGPVPSPEEESDTPSVPVPQDMLGEDAPSEPTPDSTQDVPGDQQGGSDVSHDAQEPRPITGAVEWTSPRDRLPGQNP